LWPGREDIDRARLDNHDTKNAIAMLAGIAIGVLVIVWLLLS
jgi:hypothetical protein